MKFQLSFLVMLCWLPALSQPGAAVADHEQIFVQLNSTFLITGETLYFKVLCRRKEDNTPSMLSKVAYVELIDGSGTPVLQTKISLEEGGGHGDFFIPSTFASGNYTIIAYTRWMKNFPLGNFFAGRVIVVNPFRGPVNATANDNGKSSSEGAPAPGHPGGVQLDLPQRSFRPRQKVSVTLTSEHASALCVSVRKKEANLDDAGTMVKRVLMEAAQPGDPASPISAKGEAGSTIVTKARLPEIRGHLVTGKITPKGDAGSKKNTLLASIPGLDFVFRATATDELGNFAMIVDRIPESSTMLFQVLGDEINNYTLEVDDPFLGDYSKFRPDVLSIDSSLRAIIDERNVYTQIENAYYDVNKDSATTGSPVHFYRTPDKVYRLDDFTRFPTMEDIFREYVPEVILKHLRGTFTLQVVNADTGYPYSNEPLIMVDGVPLRDANMLMTYDPLKVERMEIIRDKYFYGALEFDGIISLKTYRGAIKDLPDLNAHRESLVRIQSGRKYSFPDYGTDGVKLARVPDYRLQLYWDPNVKAGGSQTTVVDFYTSDIEGDFEIVVEGFSTDGTLVSTRNVFSVSRE